MPWSFIDVPSTDPAFNLALEQYAFDSLPRDRNWFMLWRNHNAIVIGRHQNTLAEINEAAVREKNVTVVRRLSGGGAVYHDLGNLNFTFIQDAAQDGKLDMNLFCRPVSQALQAMGVDARINGRNDITIGGRKFSGNAQYVREGRVMHHGTIMYDSDLDTVGLVLRSDPEKVRAKGVRSVRSRVTTVRAHMPQPVPLEEFKARLLQEISRERPMESYTLTEADAAAVEAIKKARYDRWEWNYGVSPPCNLLRRRRVEGCGSIEAHMHLDQGRIAALSFFGDFFSAVEPEELALLLRGCPLRQEDLRTRLKGVDVSAYFARLTAAQLIELLLDL
ncbi:MAG: lipoate--protein ligase [Oscillibacter sp.]|nr:lipoate--protein ligase [Oscillibacter sp.]